MAETTEKEMKVVFERPHSLLPVVTNFCPGCPHGIVERLVCEVMDELDIEGETIADPYTYFYGAAIPFHP